MNSYLVRLSENKEIVGFFFVDEFDELFHTVDELTNPYECEYMELSPYRGIGFFWESPGQPIIHPMSEDGETDEEDDYGGLSMTECTLNCLWDATSGKYENKFKSFS